MKTPATDASWKCIWLAGGVAVRAGLSSKLAQQLKDVLAICGSGLPAWCSRLVVQAKFLFPLEVRKR